MFQTLSDRLGQIFDRLRQRGALSEEDVTLAMREIRVALLEADVALDVVKDFTQKVKERAIGQEVLSSITPGQMVVKIVHDYLVEVLGGVDKPLNLECVPPAVVMVVGLQGSGKTTVTAKLAKFLQEKMRKKVLMASTDIYRPAAREQLEILAQQNNLHSLSIQADEKPVQIVKRAKAEAETGGFDVLLIDTAGRLHVDDDLMRELEDLKKILKPIEILLSVDAMTGQDAVQVGKTFQERLTLTGVILNRMDGDARGGAALSMRAITGCPVKFAGMGEHIHQLEVFSPERVANRILDMGDVVGLVEKAMAVTEQEEAQALAAKMQKGSFDFDDMALQLKQISKMGGLGSLLSMIPGAGKVQGMLGQAGFDDKMIAHQLAMIQSMTRQERKDHKVLNGSRRRRIAMGSGTSVPDVNRLVKQFQEMQDAMKRFKKLGQKGLMRHGIKGLLGKR